MWKAAVEGVGSVLVGYEIQGIVTYAGVDKVVYYGRSRSNTNKADQALGYSRTDAVDTLGRGQVYLDIQAQAVEVRLANSD